MKGRRQMIHTFLRYIACLGGLPLVVCFSSAPVLAAPVQQKSDRDALQSSITRQWEARSRVVENRLKKWKPTRENDQAPKAAIRSRDSDITGTWQVSRGL